jgi:hypothetical protein
MTLHIHPYPDHNKYECDRCGRTVEAPFLPAGEDRSPNGILRDAGWHIDDGTDWRVSHAPLVDVCPDCSEAGS